MTSSFTWLDYSARERRAMLSVVDLFREKGTVDELGLGTIRDAFANRLFPGTSTLHSRTRYWLFIPWLYLRLERDRVRSADADAQARRLQARLVHALSAGGEVEGVIGAEAKEKLLRPPAVVYWAGLARYGILQYAGSIGRYHASLDAYYRTGGGRRSEGDEPELIDAGRRNWHHGLPAAPADLLERATFALTRPEADYLRERFVTRAEDSMLAWALQHPASLNRSDGGPWDHPRARELPPALRVTVSHADRFSFVMYGAVLVYNAALAELAAARGHHEPALADQYHADYAKWVEDLHSRLDELHAWDRNDFWRLVGELLHGRIGGTRDFASRWIEAVLSDAQGAVDDQAIRDLLRAREQRIKGSLARLSNPRALERWNGRSGVYRLTYRWPQARTLLQDIDTGLRNGEDR
jgi:hypothetical protein